MKQIASDNPQIRQLGYRGLTGMYLAYGGMGYGAVKNFFSFNRNYTRTMGRL
jgi:hypothetical protein